MKSEGHYSTVTAIKPNFFQDFNYSFKRWFHPKKHALALWIIKKGLKLGGAFDNNMYQYAKDEVEEWEERFKQKIKTSDSEDYDSDGLEMERMMNDHVLLMVAMDAFEGHSGFSHPIMEARYKRLANFKPLNPISFDDDQWVDHGWGAPYQHKKLSTLFKNKNGSMYILDKFIFQSPIHDSENNGKENWVGFTTMGSQKYVETLEDIDAEPMYVKLRELPEGYTHPIMDKFEYEFLDPEQEKIVVENYKKIKGMA